MSEHRAAAHISGVYAVIAAMVTGLVGGVIGWYLKPNDIPPTPAPAETAADSALSGAAATKANGSQDSDNRSHAIDFGELLTQNELKQENAEPSEITMQAYYRLLEDEGVPQLDVAKQYLGKRVRWTGYFYSLNVQHDSQAQRYRILLTHDPKRFHDYLYVYLPVSAEPHVARMKNGSAVVLTGVLSGRTDLSDATIESVDNAP